METQAVTGTARQRLKAVFARMVDEALTQILRLGQELARLAVDAALRRLAGKLSG